MPAMYNGIMKALRKTANVVLVIGNTQEDASAVTLQEEEEAERDNALQELLSGATVKVLKRVLEVIPKEEHEWLFLGDLIQTIMIVLRAAKGRT